MTGVSEYLSAPSSNGSHPPAREPLSLQERKHEVVRAAIWDAATDLFAEKGYDETTVDEIAGRAGISRRSFFRYFSSKSDLMASGMVEYGTAITNAISACPRESPVSEVVRYVVVQVAQETTAFSRTRKVMQILAKYPGAKEALNSRMPELQERVKAAFASRGGPFRDLAPELVTNLTLAILEVIFHFWFEQGEPDICVAADQVLATVGCMVQSNRKAPVGGKARNR